MQIHMSRGCDIHVGNGINANGYILTQYNILRGTIDTFPSAPVACNTQIPYSLLYYTFSYVLIFTLNIYIYIYIYIYIIIIIIRVWALAWMKKQSLSSRSPNVNVGGKIMYKIKIILNKILDYNINFYPGYQ